MSIKIEIVGSKWGAGHRKQKWESVSGSSRLEKKQWDFWELVLWKRNLIVGQSHAYFSKKPYNKSMPPFSEQSLYQSTKKPLFHNFPLLTNPLTPKPILRSFFHILFCNNSSFTSHANLSLFQLSLPLWSIRLL